MKLWVVSRIDAPHGWPIFDSAWSDQEEAVAHMLSQKASQGNDDLYPRFFIGLKLIEEEAHAVDANAVTLGRPHRSAPVSVRHQHH